MSHAAQLTPTTIDSARLSRLLSLSLLAFGIALFFWRAVPVSAATEATLTVDTVTDENDGSCADGDCSLRDVIVVAVAGDTITFDAALSGQQITLGGTQLVIDKSVTISASVPISISANNASRVFRIENGANVTIDGLTIRDGQETNELGGGIYVDTNTSLMLLNSTLTNNRAQAAGAIENNGTVGIQNSTFNDNQATEWGGGAIVNRGVATVENSTFSGNSANAQGGAIHNSADATLTISYTTITNNSGVTGAGLSSQGVASADTRLYATIIAGNNGSGRDVELVSGTTNSFNSQGSNLIGTLGSNVAIASTNDQTNVTDPKLGPLADNGGNTQTHALLPDSPAIDVAATGVAADQRGVARPQGAGFDAGAFESLPAHINGSDCGLADAITAANTDSATGDCNAGSGDDTITLLTNILLSAALPDITTPITIEGSGHFIDGNASVRVMKVSGAAGDLTLNQITLQNGKTTANLDHGAGLYIGQDSSATLTNSTVRSNSTAGSGANGGGIYAVGGSVTLTNSTVSGNLTAADGAGGGGIYAVDGSVRLTFSTVSGNSTAGGGTDGGGIYAENGSVMLTNSIVVGNSADNEGNELHFVNSTANSGNNVLGNSAGSRADNFTNFTPSVSDFDASSDQQNKTTAEIINPTLADNSGLTWTHALVSNSPAIDAGGATCSVATDQRGISRPHGTACDSGAFEYPSPSLIVSTLADVENGDYSNGDNSLREAIVNASDGDTITFDAALSGQQITLDGSQLLITKSINISASVPISVSADNRSRVFRITNRANVTIDGLTILDGRVTSSNDGGGFYLTNRTSLTLRNSTVISNTVVGTFASGAAIYSEGGTIIVSHSTIAGNTAGYAAGGIRSTHALTISHSTIISNSASYGAGISIHYGSTLTLINSTMSGNRASSNGGAINNDSSTATIIDSTISDSSAGFNGGAIYLRDGTVTVANSTFSNNFANNAGGGIQNWDSTLTVTNSTFSGNSTNGAAGAIVNYGGTTTLKQSTIVSNTSPADEQGALFTDNTLFSIEQTIVANNINGDCRGLIQSKGYNLDSDGTCVIGGTDLPLADPLLGPLADNGGSTHTHALLPSSPAIDAGNNATCAATDQRGVARPLFGGENTSVATCDIGAYEANPVSYSISDGTVIEGDSGTVDLTFTITRSDTTLSGSAVVSTTDGTAQHGSDYTSIMQTVLFNSGEASKTVTVTVNGDESIEVDETFTVTLSAVVNGVIGDGVGVGTITSDDNVYYFISDGTVMEGDSGTVDLTFTITRSSTGLNGSVVVSTADGTAQHGSDYTSMTQTVLFNSGEASKTITVTVNGDEMVEADETLTVVLSAVVNGVIGDGIGAGTITDDDDNVYYFVSDGTVMEGDSGTVDLIFTITRSSTASSGSVVVSTADGTARHGSDYTSMTQMVLFNSGEASKTVTVTVNGDETVEADETLIVILTAVVNGVIGDRVGVGTIMDDDQTIYHVYLPIVLKPTPQSDAPDLIVETFVVSSSGIDVTVRNVGSVATGSDFWVDLSIDPAPAPTAPNTPLVNGFVWYFTGRLAPNEAVTLRMGDAYHLINARWNGGTLSAGTPLYVHVDSADSRTNHGAILETHEINNLLYNNIATQTLSETIVVPTARRHHALPSIDVPRIDAIAPN